MYLRVQKLSRTNLVVEKSKISMTIMNREHAGISISAGKKHKIIMTTR